MYSSSWLIIVILSISAINLCLISANEIPDDDTIPSWINPNVPTEEQVNAILNNCTEDGIGSDGCAVENAGVETTIGTSSVIIGGGLIVMGVLLFLGYYCYNKHSSRTPGLHVEEDIS